MGKGQRPSRKLTFIAFFCAAVSLVGAQTLPKESSEGETQVPASGSADEPQAPEQSEADKAYNQAVRAIRSLRAIQPAQAAVYYDAETQPNAVLATLFPNEKGPIHRLIKFAYQLRYDSWFPMWISRRFGSRTGRRREEVKARALRVVDLLYKAVELGHEDAIYTMADISMFPPPVLSTNLTRAFEFYSKHADLTGNATSQAMLGFFHATGYGSVVDVDQVQALLHYTFAAVSGDQRAQLVMGYRHWAGIGVNEDCMSALAWYEAAAERAMANFQYGPPGGRTLPPTSTRLSDLEGGVYGPGASVASTGANLIRSVVKAAHSRAAGETWEDVMEYYQYHADRGEFDFSFRLGKIYYHGSVYQGYGGAASGAEGAGMIGRDFTRARAHFLRITRHVWPTPNTKHPLHNRKKDVDDKVGVTASMAAGYLGRMYLRGEGVKADAKVAKMWFERGVTYGERESQHGLGLIYRDGLVDAKPDLAKAMNYFTAAAGQDLAEAQVALGKHQYETGDYVRATTFFEAAIRHGSPFEAYYYLAEMQANNAHDPTANPSLRAGACGVAVSFYKLVGERGFWEDDYVTDAERLWDFNGVRTGGRGKRSGHKVPGGSSVNHVVRDVDRDGAKLRWAIAAESGSEVAQNNLAYLMDQGVIGTMGLLRPLIERSDRSALRHTGLVAPASNETARLALTHWIRSASQRNVDALVKVGDYYYHGLGISEESEEARFEKAADYYHRAVETQLSALAMWNLGWMYENGIGVVQDFHLAKRHYDMALETNVEAYLPVTLSLAKLYLRSAWYKITGGTEKSLSLFDSEDPEDGWGFGRTTKEDKRRTTRELEAPGTGTEDDGNYNDDEDSMQWARDRKREEADRAQAERDADGFGSDDYFDAAISGPGRRGEANFDRDDTLDDLIFMMVLCGILGALIYMRTRWVRLEEQRVREQAIRPEVGNPGVQ